MSSTHDKLTTIVGDYITKKIREEDIEWKQVFSSTTSRVGDWSWPRPDYVCKDYENNVTCSFEFKPPNQTKREYLTGLGQSLSYLQKHNYSGLILPEIADDGFAIVDFVKNTLISDDFNHLPITLVSYHPDTLESDIENSVKLVKKIDNIRTSPLIQGVTTNSTYWAFWRDISHYEIFLLLKLSDKYSDKKGDIYTNYIYPDFYDNYLITGKAQDWEGRFRVKTGSLASKKSEKQNYKIPLFHLNLWSQSEGRLTYKGYQLLMFGKMFGVNSKEYLDYLTYLLLTEGRHLELINEINTFQTLNYNSIAEKADIYKKNVDLYLEKKGSIGDRKPTAITTNAKGTYIRDEFKVWNKLNLLHPANKSSYFFKKQGLKFDWDKITTILMKRYIIDN